MIYVKQLNALIASDADSYRKLAKQVRENIELLDAIQKEDYAAGATPKHTVEAYIDAIGFGTAKIIIASLINVSSWDGRISKDNKEWAANVVQSYDTDSMQKMHADTRIHRTHLDQLADVMRII